MFRCQPPGARRRTRPPCLLPASLLGTGVLPGPREGCGQTLPPETSGTCWALAPRCPTSPVGLAGPCCPSSLANKPAGSKERGRGAVGQPGRGGSVPHRDCHEQAWAVPAAGTPEDSNLSQTCVLIPVQPIYIHNSCYFFPSYMDASCPRSPLPSPSKPCCFSHACPGRRGASSPWGRARCSPGRHVGAALPPAAPRPRRPLPPAPGQEPRRTQPGLCEHGVCFARVTCLIISFSGGRLFLVSTVTAPLRGEAIRQRVKQVIKTLKPCAHWEGGRASRTQRDETGRAREAAGAPEPVRRGDTRLASQPRQGTGCQRAPAASRHAALVRCHLGRRCCRQRAALAGPALLAPS